MCPLIYRLPTSSPKVFLVLSLTSFIPSFMSVKIRRSACAGGRGECQGYVTLISYLNIRLNILSLILGYSLVHIYSFYFYLLCKWQYIEETLTTIIGGVFLQTFTSITELLSVQVRMKILVTTNISVFWFYGYVIYIGRYFDIKYWWVKNWSKLMKILQIYIIIIIIEILRLFC